MPFTVTHILIAVILIELFREYFIKDNRKFPRYYILIGAIGAILPDLDFAFFYILYPFDFTIEQVHRTFLHNIFIPLILFLIGLIFLKLKVKSRKLGERHMKLSTIFFILAFGSLLHLILDAIFSGTIMWFYPFSRFSFGFNLLQYFPEQIQWLILPTIDGILLFFWIFWLEFKLKISDYF